MPASPRRVARRLLVLGCAAASVCMGSIAHAQYVPIALDVSGIRFKMPYEGYLQYQPNPLVGRFGDEYTGWIDVRHPARASTTAADEDTNFGFDMSDHILNLRTTRLIDSTGAAATPNPKRDFDFANQAWAQAGLSMIQTAHRTYTSGDAVPGGNPVNFTFPADFNPVATSPFGSGGNAGTIGRELTNGNTAKAFDVYYSTTNSPNVNTSLRGYAYNSGQETANFKPFAVIGTSGKDAAVADTFGHEVGHFLLNGPSVDNPSGGDPGHSATNTNLMAGGSIRWYPGLPQNGLNNPPGGPPSAIPESLVVVGPSIALNADNTPKVGGINQLTAGNGAQSQVKRVFDSTNNSTTTRWYTTSVNAGAGNRVDFDFNADAGRRDGNINPTDVLNLDGVPGADNFPGATGERLYWGLPTGPLAPSAAGDKKKTGLGVFGPADDFGGQFFKYADIFSLTVRYSDWDSDTTPDLSTRESALDYEVRFRNAAGLESPGVPVVVFQDGWSVSTQVEDYLARWTPQDPNFQAVGLFILALDGQFSGARYDAVTQIDAVIVSQVLPEPCGAILACGAAALVVRRGRRRST